MDAITLLVRDHRLVEELFEQFRTAMPETRQPIAERIVRELAIHAGIEETRFYPAVRAEVPAGDPLVDHGLDEHLEIKEALARVDGEMDKAHTKKFEQDMARVEEVVRHHVREEEDNILPAVAEYIPKARLQAIGMDLEQAKAMVPTRPHPNAPDEPPFNEVVGRVSGVLDRLRDTASGRGRH